MSLRRLASRLKRKKRSVNFSDRADKSSLPSLPKVERTKSLRATPSSSVMRILCESSIRIPTKFRCGTTEVSTSVGWKSMKTRIATKPNRSTAINPPVHSAAVSPGGSIREECRDGNRRHSAQNEQGRPR